MSRFPGTLVYFSIALVQLVMIGGILKAPKKEFMAGFAVVFVLINVILCCFWKKIQIAIAIIDTTADFLASTKRIIFVSIFYGFLAMALCLLASAALVAAEAVVKSGN